MRARRVTAALRPLPLINDDGPRIVLMDFRHGSEETEKRACRRRRRATSRRVGLGGGAENTDAKTENNRDVSVSVGAGTLVRTRSRRHVHSETITYVVFPHIILLLSGKRIKLYERWSVVLFNRFLSNRVPRPTLIN